jgi:hypothetical protein
MKKVSEILSHIRNQPQFRYLKKQECFSRYISLLPMKWQKAISFVYIRNNTLFIAINHPAFKMELNYNKDLLTSILRDLKTYVIECKELQASDIVIFVSRYNKKKSKEADEETVPYYYEASSGDFKIEANSSDIAEKFKEIQKSIKSQYD